MRALVLTLSILAAIPIIAEPITYQEHEMILLIGDSLGVPGSITNWLQVEESGDRKTGGWGDAKAIGPIGADGARCRGLFQLSPIYEVWLVKMFYPHDPAYFDIWNPIDNAVVALEYLAWLHGKYGSWERALWYFNYGDVIMVPNETKAYARRIIEARGRY